MISSSDGGILNKENENEIKDRTADYENAANHGDLMSFQLKSIYKSLFWRLGWDLVSLKRGDINLGLDKN